MIESQSDRVCVVCKNPLTVHTRREYRGDPSLEICGPGGRSQLTTVIETVCTTCGLKYVNGGGIEQKVPLKKRVQRALAEAKNDLALARDRAKDKGDTELVDAILDLMSKVG